MEEGTPEGPPPSPSGYLGVAVYYDDRQPRRMGCTWRWTTEQRDAYEWLLGEPWPDCRSSVGYVLTVEGSRIIHREVFERPNEAGATVITTPHFVPLLDRVCAESGIEYVSQGELDFCDSDSDRQRHMRFLKETQAAADSHAAAVMHNRASGQDPLAETATNGEAVITGCIAKEPFDGVPLPSEWPDPDLEYDGNGFKAHAHGESRRCPHKPGSQAADYWLDCYDTAAWRAENPPEFRDVPDTRVSGEPPSIRVAILSTGAAGSVCCTNTGDWHSYDCTGTTFHGHDGLGHGTALRSIMSGVFGDEPELDRVGPDAELLSIKVRTDSGWGSDQMVARGIDLARDLDCAVIVIDGRSSTAMASTKKAMERAAGEGRIIVVCGTSAHWSGEDRSWPAVYDFGLTAMMVMEGGHVSRAFRGTPWFQVGADSVGVIGIGADGDLGKYQGPAVAAARIAVAAVQCLSATRVRVGASGLARRVVEAIITTGKLIYQPRKDGTRPVTLLNTAAAVAAMGKMPKL